MLPPLYSGEIQPAILFLFRVATTTLFQEQAPGTFRLVGWVAATEARR